MTGGWLWWVGFALACVLFGVVLYSRWRMGREERRPGYLIPPNEPGSWYEERDGMVRPTQATREAWARGEDPTHNQ